jgi:hypothetical protein
MSEKSTDREVTVRLTGEDVIERAEAMARRVAEVERLRKKKADDSKSTQALIDTALDEIARLGRVITAQAELRKQGELFAGDEVIPSTAESTQALALIAEQSALMDQTDAAIDANAVPVIEAAPEHCPKCTGSVKLFDDGARVMCEAAECTWVAKIQPPPTEEERAAAMQWVASNGGGDALIEAAAMYWERMQPRSTFEAAMVGWCASSGAPALAATLHRESIEKARDNIGFAGEVHAKTPGVQKLEAEQAALDAKLAETTTVCEHAAIQGRRRPLQGKTLLCPDCTEELDKCEACRRFEAKDSMGPCEWDECGGSRLCLRCLHDHESREGTSLPDSEQADDGDRVRA